MTKFTCGADPEMFLTKDGDYVAVQPYVKGTKRKPQPLSSGGNVQRDNVAIEFGILPANSKIDFVQNIGKTLLDVVNILPIDVDIDIVPSANFPKEQLKSREARRFACDPDFNVWTGMRNKPPENAAEGTFRSCGGHIHIGQDKEHYMFLKDTDGKEMVVRVCDCLLGIISTVLDNSASAIDRRMLYGKAGCYRKTSYGVEYRTLSNYWIKSPVLVELMYSLVNDVLEIVEQELSMDLVMAIGIGEIQRIIEEGDSSSAMDIINDLLIPNHLSTDSVELLGKVMELDLNNINYKEEWGKVA